MKNIFTFFSFVILLPAWVHVSAQSFPCSSVWPLSCAANPVVPTYTDSDISVMYNMRYSVRNMVVDISYKNNNPYLSDCGDVIPYACKPDPGNLLVYNVYYPSEKSAYTCYKERPLPAILLFHGGGFSDCNYDDDGGNMDKYCREFAKRGFVAFDVRYRSGRLKDFHLVNDEPGNNYLSASSFLATYRAYQDARGALRSIITLQSTPAAPPYRIDLDNIFVGGTSSGGMIAMSLAYYTSDMLYEIFSDAPKKMGSLDDDLYRGPGSLRFKVKGVLDLWGGLYMPANYNSNPDLFFNKNKTRTGTSLNPPMIAFQGSLDNIMPVTKAYVYYSSDSFYRSATVCNPATEDTFYLPFNDSDKPNKDLVLYGSKGFYGVLTKNLGIPAELYLDSDMKHGLSNVSDFGTDAKVQWDRTLIIPYIVERSAAFFQAIINNVAVNLQDTRFTDCENYRYGCSPENNHENCMPASVLSMDKMQVDLNQTPAFRIIQANRNITVQFKNNSPAIVTLFDLYGRPLKNISTNSMQAVLQCNTIPSGIYIVKAIQGNITETKKIGLY